MNDYLGKISKAINEVNVDHDCYHDCIHINLPNDFGILEIKIWNEDEDTIQLLKGDFHTHGEQEASEFELPKEKAIAMLVNKIFTGEYLLIEEKEPKKATRKLIVQSLKKYLKYLPAGTEYKIANKI